MSDASTRQRARGEHRPGLSLRSERQRWALGSRCRWHAKRSHGEPYRDQTGRRAGIAIRSSCGSTGTRIAIRRSSLSPRVCSAKSMCGASTRTPIWLPSIRSWRNISEYARRNSCWHRAWRASSAPSSKRLSSQDHERSTYLIGSPRVGRYSTPARSRKQSLP